MVEIKYSVYDTDCTPLVSVQPVLDGGYGQDDCLRVIDAFPAPITLGHRMIHDSVTGETISDTSSSPSTDCQSGTSIDEYISRDQNEFFHDEEQRQTALAAGVASAAFGLLICGPIGALMLGCGAVYAAENKPEGNGVGDAARAVGDVALVAADRARAINSRHKVVEHTKRLAHTSYSMIDQVDRDYRILERTTNAVTFSWNKTVGYVQRKNFFRRGVDSVGFAVCWAAEKIANALSATGNSETETVGMRSDENINADMSLGNLGSISQQRTHPTAPVESYLPEVSPNSNHRPAVQLHLY